MYIHAKGGSSATQTVCHYGSYLRYEEFKETWTSKFNTDPANKAGEASATSLPTEWIHKERDSVPFLCSLFSFRLIFLITLHVRCSGHLKKRGWSRGRGVIIHKNFEFLILKWKNNKKDQIYQTILEYSFTFYSLIYERNWKRCFCEETTLLHFARLVSLFRPQLMSAVDHLIRLYFTVYWARKKTSESP